MVEPTQVLGGDPIEARERVVVPGCQGLDPELPFPEPGQPQPGRIDVVCPEPVDQLARLCPDLQGDRRTLPLDDLWVHRMGRDNAVEPLQSEQGVFFADPHEIERASRGDGGVVDAAALFDLTLDLLLAPSWLVAEQHVLGEVRQLFFPPRVRVGANRQGHADRDHGIVTQELVPNL